MPRQSAIKMMETMKTLAPAERRPQQHAPASAPRAAPTAPAPAPAVPEAAPKRKGGALPQGPPSGGGAAAAAAAPAEPAAKRRRPAGDPSVGVLEWLEAEAEKREIDHSNPALPAGIAPPQRPTSAALLFLHKIRSRIKQPPNSAWGPKQLAQGVTRLFEALPPAHQQQYRQAAKESMDRYKAELARHRPLGSKALECGSSADQGRGRAPSAYKVYERNVMPRLRHANPSKHEEDLIKMCKKEWGGISEKERKTYQVLHPRASLSVGAGKRARMHACAYAHLHPGIMPTCFHTCMRAKRTAKVLTRASDHPSVSGGARPRASAHARAPLARGVAGHLASPHWRRRHTGVQ